MVEGRSVLGWAGSKSSWAGIFEWMLADRQAVSSDRAMKASKNSKAL